MKIGEYTVHPAAEAMPEMPDDEFENLRSDIETNGLICPVELHEGKIIDGRHRAAACEDLGREPSYIEADLGDQSPAAYVLSLNFARRHLTTSQKAAIAVELLGQFEDEAKRRQRDHGGTAPGKAKNTSGIIAGSETKGESREKAAQAAGVSPRLVSDAKALKKASPAEFEKVKRGEKTVAAAKRESAPKADSKPAPAEPVSPVAEQLADDFFDRSAKQITEIRKGLKRRLEDNRHRPHVEGFAARLDRELRACRGTLAMAAPSAECHKCGGKGCNYCLGTGYLVKRQTSGRDAQR